MVTVIHYNDGRDPDIYFKTNENTEQKILRKMADKYDVRRASAEEWYGQDNPNYKVHHWNAERRRGK